MEKKGGISSPFKKKPFLLVSSKWWSLVFNCHRFDRQPVKDASLDQLIGAEGGGMQRSPDKGKELKWWKRVRYFHATQYESWSLYCVYCCGWLTSTERQARIESPRNFLRKNIEPVVELSVSKGFFIDPQMRWLRRLLWLGMHRRSQANV